MKSYRDLEIYKESKKLAIEIHKMTLQLPKLELFEEGGQIRRSSKSVTAMIVEGYARKRYKGDFVKYLVYGQAECDETMVHLDFLFDTQSLKDKDSYERFHSEYEILSKKINKYIQWVDDSWNEFPSSEPSNQ